MSEQTPDLGPSADIDAAELDVDAPAEPTPTSDAQEYDADGESLGGTGGRNAGGAG